MNCGACGTPLPEGATRCPRCGAATSYCSGTTAAAPDDPTVASSPYHNPYEPYYVTPLAIPDRTVLRRQLEETRSAFHAVVESLTDADWHRKTSSTAWTIGEVLTHLVSTLAHTPEAIEHLRQGKNYHNPPSFLSWLGPLINRRLAQQSARGQTHASILAWYNTAHTTMLATVEGVGDDEWGRGAYCFGAGYKTILDLCQYLPSHFQEHAAQIAASK